MAKVSCCSTVLLVRLILLERWAVCSIITDLWEKENPGIESIDTDHCEGCQSNLSLGVLPFQNNSHNSVKSE